MRIASLLPSATEIVCALGLRDQLVAVSHSCDYPAGVRSLPIVTRTTIDDSQSSAAIDGQVDEHLESSSALYAIETDTLAALAPDLVITQALCDVCAVSGDDVAKALSDLPGSPQLINLEPYSFEDVLETISLVGKAVGAEARAEQLVRDLQDRIAAARIAGEARPEKPRTVVIDWIDPPFVSGHWMHDLITLAGCADVMNTAQKPSYRSSWADIVAAKPDHLIIACCGFEPDRTEAELSYAPEASDAIEALKAAGADVHIVDGNGLFSRPGPRLVDSLELLARLTA